MLYILKKNYNNRKEKEERRWKIYEVGEEENVRFLSVIGSFGRHDSFIHSVTIPCLCKAF